MGNVVSIKIWQSAATSNLGRSSQQTGLLCATDQADMHEFVHALTIDDLVPYGSLT